MKERLVGAIVLVVAAVVFVPMILSGPDTPPSAVPSRAAPSERSDVPGGELSSRIAPMRASPPRSGEPRTAASAAAPARTAAPVASRPREPAAANSKAPEVAAAPEKRGKPEKKEHESLATKPMSVKAPAAAPKPATAPSQAGWVVQIGSFASERNAEGLRQQLRKKGYRSFVESVSRDGARVTRVLVGPQPSKQKSKAQLEGLYKETGLKGIVVRHGS